MLPESQGHCMDIAILCNILSYIPSCHKSQGQWCSRQIR